MAVYLGRQHGSFQGTIPSWVSGIRRPALDRQPSHDGHDDNECNLRCCIGNILKDSGLFGGGTAD
jgi:hypothetical protein